MAEEHRHDPLDHVVDNSFIEVPWSSIWTSITGNHTGSWSEIRLPYINLGPLSFQVTRFMVMELIVAVLIAAIIIPLARHISKYPVTRGAFFNAFEAMVLFIRDGVARPAIGGHDADQYLPYLWTVFLFVLGCNLLGMIPGGASPTGNVNVTAVLALGTFGVVLYTGMKKMGPLGYWIALVPKLDVPKFMKGPMFLLMFFIEVAGLLIRHVVLSVRLFANMLAGHIVLAVILGFILEAGGYFTYVVTPASVMGVVALSLLELFVAFLQAYIFTFLSALFIGSAVHPH